MKILGVIPSRYGSTRFPGKPLASIAGTSMIERVYRQAIQAKSLTRLVVATDDERILQHVTAFGGEAILTSSDHPSGTDRCNEVLEKLGANFEYVINIQGDEPFIDPEQIDVLAGMLKDDSVEIATLMMVITSNGALHSESEAKIVVNHKNEALYFSRQPIPYLREIAPGKWHEHFTYYSHVGMYAYRSDVLKEITKLPPSALEKAEMLEQLRWIENGFTIKCGITDKESYSIDTPEDIERVLRLRNFV